MVATPYAGPPRSDSSEGWTVLGARVLWRPVPDGLPGGRDLPRAQIGRLEATADRVWFEDDRMRLLVLGTEEVWLDTRPGVSRSDVAHAAYGFAASILLVHGGRFSIHGSAVRTAAGETLVVAGDSGAGKSTTTMALAARGGRLLVDDVAPLRPTPDGVLIEPFDRPVHLLDDAIDRLGLAGSEHVWTDRIGGLDGKAVVSVDVGPSAGPARVDRLVLLVAEAGVGHRPVVRPVTGAERLRRVVRLSNVTGIASFGPRAEHYFSWAAAVADGLEVVEVRRDDETDTLDEVLDAVVATTSRG